VKQADPTYIGGAEGLIAHWQIRRAPIDCAAGEGLPGPEMDLAALSARIVPAALPPLEKPASGFAKKQRVLAEDLAGCSELALLNALVIAHLRKREHPAHAAALFNRIWAEQTPALVADLPIRWLISTVITFADHGANEADRHVGQSLNLLFSMMKLYEFERQFSGTKAAVAFELGQRLKQPLPLGMPDFSLATGGLDINLLAPIWQIALKAPTIGPLACYLLDALNHAPDTIFRRLSTMRATKRAALTQKTIRR
jgi:hypothetical protein